MLKGYKIKPKKLIFFFLAWRKFVSKLCNEATNDLITKLIQTQNIHTLRMRYWDELLRKIFSDLDQILLVDRNNYNIQLKYRFLQFDEGWLFNYQHCRYSPFTIYFVYSRLCTYIVNQYHQMPQIKYDRILTEKPQTWHWHAMGHNCDLSIIYSTIQSQ